MQQIGQQTVGTQPLLLSEKSVPKLNAAAITQRIEMLLSAYRRDDYADPEKFVAQLGVVLSGYDADVVEYVTDPRTGIQRTNKWPPSIQEVVEACDNRIAAKVREAEIDAWQEKKRKSDEIKKLYGRGENKPTTGISYDEFLKRCAESGENPRPKGRFE